MTKKTKKAVLMVAFHFGIAMLFTWYLSETLPYYGKTNAQQSENLYQSCFSLLNEEVSSLASELEECAFITDKVYLALSLSNVTQHAKSAASLMGVLPFSHEESSKTLVYFNTVGDFSSVMLEKLVEGRSLSESEVASLGEFSGFAESLKSELESLGLKLNSPDADFAFSSEDGLYFGEEDNYATSMFTALNTQLDEMTPLEYEGRYSSSLKNPQYKALGDLPQVGKEELTEKVNAYLNERDDISAEYGSQTGGNIDGHSFSLNNNGKNYTAVFSSAGGKLISISGDAADGEKKIGLEEAKKKAEEFLLSIGLAEMQLSSYQSDDNTASFEYIARSGGDMLFADKVNIRVSLSDASVVGFDSSEYYKNHTVRSAENQNAFLKEEELAAFLPAGMSVSAVRRGYYQNEGGSENVCCEFTGEYNGKNYLIYVDAQNGRIRDIKRSVVNEGASYSY